MHHRGVGEVKYFLLFLLMFCSVAQAKMYTFYCDTHIGSVSPMDIIPTTEKEMLAQNAYDGGDSFEIKNAEKNNCLNIKTRWANHKKLFAGRYVTGNHSLEREPFDLLIDGKILLTHGDRPLWSTSKSDEFRREKSCQGSGVLQKIWFSRNGSVSNSEAKELANYTIARKGKVSVSCHVHVVSKFDQTVNGIRVINLPRGRSEISVP